MILALRHRHRRIFTVLAFVLPAALALGIAARAPTPANATFAAAAAGPAQFESTQPLAGFFGRLPARVNLLREHKTSGRFALELNLEKNFLKPDLIVYWNAGNTTVTDAVPDEAILIGPPNSSPLVLPEMTERTTGTVLVYSLADGEVVDVSRPFSPPGQNSSAQ